jgi:hypothetical protein
MGGLWPTPSEPLGAKPEIRPKFGPGRIVQIDDGPMQKRAVVHCNEPGRKPLMLAYAKLEPAG